MFTNVDNKFTLYHLHLEQCNLQVYITPLTFRKIIQDGLLQMDTERGDLQPGRWVVRGNVITAKHN